MSEIGWVMLIMVWSLVVSLGLYLTVRAWVLKQQRERQRDNQ